MNSALVWTPQARENLLDIYVMIGVDNPSAAERLYTRVEKRVNLPMVHPRLGLRRPDIAPTARMLVEGVYLILYETHPDTDDGPIDSIEIVRVVHGYRELSRIF